MIEKCRFPDVTDPDFLRNAGLMDKPPLNQKVRDRIFQYCIGDMTKEDLADAVGDEGYSIMAFIYGYSSVVFAYKELYGEEGK